jgi:DNA invertase Pin-like site-specific DNA recombinase
MTQVGIYVRVSTSDQNLDRQLERATQYASEELDVELDDVEIYRDKQTGTDTVRSGYQELMSELDATDVVVVHEISRMARSLQDLERTVTRITEHNSEIHFVRDGLNFGDGKEKPMQRLQLQMLGAFSEWEAKVKRMNTKEGIAARQADDDYHHGRAPLGFQKDDGQLIEGDNYHQVCATLDMVAKGELSKRKAAAELNTSRSTIRSAINDRPDLYGI